MLLLFSKNIANNNSFQNLNLFNKLKLYFSKDRDLELFIYKTFGFFPKNLDNYIFAFKHKSLYRDNKVSREKNDRLEYLGDAVIDIIVADYLFKVFPNKEVGFLTEMRSKIVSRSNLNNFSVKLNINKQVKVNTELKNVFRTIYGDIFEVLFAVIYLEYGFKFTQKILINKVIKRFVDIDNIQNIEINYKSKIVEWSQKNKKSIEFNTIDTLNSGYDKKYIVEILIDKISYGVGEGFSIKAAEKDASEKAVSKINQTEQFINS